MGSNSITMRVKASSLNATSPASYVSGEFTIATVPSAPIISNENDATNEITFSFVQGYTSANLYQIKIANGEWNTVDDVTIGLQDINYAIGDIAIRVAQNIHANVAHPAGISASNSTAFIPTPQSPTAPSALIVDDINDTIDWTFVTGYEQINDYEVSINNSAYQSASDKPYIVGNIASAAGSLKIRVKADKKTGRAAGDIANNIQIFTIPPSILLAIIAEHQQTINALSESIKQFNITKSAINETGSALRSQAKELHSIWFKLSQSVNQAALSQTAITQALMSASVLETQANKAKAQEKLDALTATLNAARNIITPTDSAIISAFNDASSLAPVTQHDAMIALSTFAKIDIAGNLIESDTTVEQGWRCLVDTSAKTRVVWALLSPVNPVDENANNSDASTRQENTYNSQEICGISNWAFPSNAQIQTLNASTPQGWVTLNQSGKITTNSDFTYWFDGLNARLWQRTQAQGALIDQPSAVSGVPANFANAQWKLADKATWQQLNSDESANEFIATLSTQEDYWIAPENNDKWFASITDSDISTNFVYSFYSKKAYQLASALLATEHIPQVEVIANSQLFPNHDKQTYWLAPSVDKDGIVTGEISTFAFPSDNKIADNTTNATSRFIMVQSPQTPSLIASDDSKNTFTLTMINNYHLLSDYQLTLDGGENWHVLTDEKAEIITVNKQKQITVSVGNVNYSHDDVGVRIIKSDTTPASDIVYLDIDFTQVRCDGIELDDVCYSVHLGQKTWQEANAICRNNNQTLLSKDAINDWNSFAHELSLATARYWLIEESSQSYAHTLTGPQYQGANWAAGQYDTSSKTSEHAYICANDYQAPTLTSTSINEADTDINVADAFLLTFSEAIDSANIASLVTLSDNNGSAVGITVTINGQVLTIQPDETLAENAAYSLLIQGTVNDLYTNSLVINRTINFTTADLDTVALLSYNGKNYTVSTEKIVKDSYAQACPNSEITVSDFNEFATQLKLDKDQHYLYSPERETYKGFFGWSNDYNYGGQRLYICQVN